MLLLLGDISDDRSHHGSRRCQALTSCLLEAAAVQTDERRTRSPIYPNASMKYPITARPGYYMWRFLPTS